MMFQRGDPSPSDEHLGSFFGLAMPLVKHGLPVEPAQLENAPIAGALGPHKVLLMTYEGMKPMTPEVHIALADWVRKGGALVFFGDDSDPYNAVRAWWNDRAKNGGYRAPREHLFEQLGLPGDAPEGDHKVGSGLLIFDKASPAALTYRPDGADHIREVTRRACEAVGLPYRATNHLVLRRGPYVVAAGLDESIEAPPMELRGHFLDLFDARLPVVETVTLAPGARKLLLDLDRARPAGPAVLASACKILGAQTMPDGAFRFHAEGPERVEAVLRVALPGAPKGVDLDGQPLAAEAQVWDTPTRTLLLRFPNASQGHRVVIR
jgi:hypothetical protein